MSQSQNMTSS